MRTKVAGISRPIEVLREIDGITETRSGPLSRFHQLVCWFHNEMESTRARRTRATSHAATSLTLCSGCGAELEIVAMLITRVSFVNSVNNNDASRLMESVAAISDRWNNRRSCVGSSLWFSELQWIGVLAMLARVQATSGATSSGTIGDGV